jgi:hypothetical protein
MIIVIISIQGWQVESICRHLPAFAMVNTGMDFMINAGLAFTKKESFFWHKIR